ncbi:MAG: M20 family metallopeptidase [Phycisphaerales bacterium]
MPTAPDTARLRDLIAAELPSLAALRHDLHAHPELGYHEHRTSGVVQRELAAIGIKHIAGLAGGTGVVGLIEATDPAAQNQPAVGLRADMDCLPITEQTGVPYASTTPGLMHACGHDGHTAMLIGAARVLSKLAHRPRSILLFFQPAEEGGGGADRFCKEGVLDGKVIGPRVEKMFGLHGWPDLPLGTVATRPGPLLASTDEIRVTIHGTQAHGAYPHYSRDTIVCAAHVIVALQTVVSRNIGPLDSVVVTIGKVEGGTATNIIPEKTSFIGTIRALRPETRALARSRVREVCEGVATALGCRAEVELNEGYPVTHNDAALTDEFFRIARAGLGPERVLTMPHPTMGGEDFSYYAQHAAAVFFCLGLRKPGAAGEKFATLHQPDFDFNDDAMPTGIEMFCRLATA